MAVLGCGSYRFSNILSNKSYIYVKLTESAHKALEEYVKYKNICKHRPTLKLGGNEGEIRIPGHAHNGWSFKFQLQKAQDSDGPQGSFECIKQVAPNCLDSLGPLSSIMRIQATDDSYEKTKQSMANAMAQTGKTCVKELNPNGVIGRHHRRRRRPPLRHGSSLTIPLPPYHTQNGTSSPLRGILPGQLTKLPVAEKVNEVLRRKPLKERIIHLLAAKPLSKLELMQKLHSDGLKDSDKRNIMSVVQAVATCKENHYFLLKHLWSEVDDNWPFYSDEDRNQLKKNRPQSVSPLLKDPSSPSNDVSSCASVDNLKRKKSNLGYGSNMKKRRFANASGFPGTTVGPADSSPDIASGGGPRNVQRPMPSCAEDFAEPSLMNGHFSPSGISIAPLSQNTSPRSMFSVICKLSPQERWGRNKGINSSLSSSPDSQQENMFFDSLSNHKEQYPQVQDNEQKKRYKAEFNRIHDEYQSLHAELEKTKEHFEAMNANLGQVKFGGPEYMKLKDRFLKEYHSRQDAYHERKNRYNYLHLVLNHIKQQIHDYDEKRRKKKIEKR